MPDFLAPLTLDGQPLGDAATADVGTTAGTVAAGNDPRFDELTNPVVDHLALGTNPAQDGLVRLANDGTIAWRDQANATNAGAITTDTADSLDLRATGGVNFSDLFIVTADGIECTVPISAPNISAPSGPSFAHLEVLTDQEVHWTEPGSAPIFPDGIDGLAANDPAGLVRRTTTDGHYLQIAAAGTYRLSWALTTTTEATLNLIEAPTGTLTPLGPTGTNQVRALNLGDRLHPRTTTTGPATFTVAAHSRLTITRLGT